MGNRKKMGKTESHQETQKEQPNNSRLSVDGDTAIAPEEEENDSNTATIAIDAIAMATTIAARWKSDDSVGFNVDCPLNPTHNGNENNVEVPNVPIVLPSDVDDANISRTEFDVDLMSKSNSLLIEKHTDGVVAKTTEEKSECVEASIVCRNNPDFKSVNEDPELSIDNHALQHEQLLNMKQQNQQQHRNYQLHLHHPHTHPQQHPPPPKIYSGHQHQQVPQHPQLSQFLQTPNNTSSLTANNRPQHQHQQQQGLITLPAIPTPCYVQQQANSSTLQPLGVDFLQPVNHHQLFPIANPTHQVMGPIPPLHFPAISNSQHQHQHHQHNIIVPSSHNAPGIHQLNQTAPSILSPSFKNLDQQQNIMCQSLNQQHQQNIMQQIEWQIQLQKNHIRQQQQQQLHNLRQNLHHQQLLQLHNSGILYQHPLKHRQNKNNQTNAHQCNPQHQHQHQQQHQQQLQQQIHQHQLNNMLQMQNQIRPHNSKIDLLCSNLDNHANTISDVRANQKVQSLHQHLQQHPDDEEQHIPSQILQQQVHSTEHKRQPKLDQPQQEEQQQQPQQQQTQQSSTVLIAQSQQSTNGINSTIASAAVATNTTNAPTSTTPTASTSNQGVNLYVKHLDADVDDSALKKMFSRFGEVVSAKVMMEGQMSRGFGFVCFARAEDAARATRDIRRKSDDLSSMKNLYVAPAQRKEERQAIFRERLRSFMEDTPSGTAGQDNDTKAFTKPPSAKERKLSTPPEGLSGQSMPTSSERSLEKANTHAKLISVGEGAGSSNTFQNKPKTTTMPSPKRIDDKNQCVRINHKENARKISPCNSFTFSLSQSRRPSRKQPPMKHIFDLDNFSLEKLNVPLLKTAGQSYLPVHKNVQYSSMFSQDITEESQAEPIPHWFFGTDEEESASYHDALGKELFGNKDQVGYFQPAVPMTDPSTEFAQWLSLGICPKSVSCINFPKELNQAPDKFVCESASPRVGENTKMAGVNGLVKDKYCEGMQIYTHSLDSWCENTNLWNCKLITKEDNRIMNEKEEEETEEKNGTLLEIREECTETLDDCNRLVKACISCCTDTDSCNSGDEDIDQEYKENNHSILDTKCERGDYFGSMQNGQNNNSTNDDDVSACLSPLTKWTKRRKRDLSSDERTTVVETKIYDMAQESEDSNQLAHFKIVVASTPNRYKIRVLDLPVVTAPSRSRKRKCTTAPLSVDVEGGEIALPKMKKVDGKCNNMIPFKKCKHACLANALGKEVTI